MLYQGLNSLLEKSNSKVLLLKRKQRGLNFMINYSYSNASKILVIESQRAS